MNESMRGSTSSKRSWSKPSKWEEVKAKVVDVSQGKVEKEKVKVAN